VGIKEDLANVKAKLEEAKQKKAQLEGQEQQLMSQLQKEFGCKTVTAAEKKLAALERDITNSEASIAAGLSEIKEELGW